MLFLEQKLRSLSRGRGVAGGEKQNAIILRCGATPAEKKSDIQIRLEEERLVPAPNIHCKEWLG